MPVTINATTIGFKKPILVKTTPKSVRASVGAMKAMAHLDDKSDTKDDPMEQMNRFGEMLDAVNGALKALLDLKQPAMDRLESLDMDVYMDFALRVFNAVVSGENDDGKPIKPDPDSKK